eukprot:CAMPEP_0206551440 /NCGR_PEP_ID=MMETSP0325_2-20121206/15531_1 /ASSEMBLY_ACC=CAM_ASM_000347 /TAXON_ID=2866 /ORGANISM="Crypthecodinium cohnii, Strain Seligo" /LENGTH=104 /DNA_ID=CAMNT_0054051213 /DNA_START=1102 /DNA_END=1413 /DNA_ORIENTATION=-
MEALGESAPREVLDRMPLLEVVGLPGAPPLREFESSVVVACWDLTGAARASALWAGLGKLALGAPARLGRAGARPKVAIFLEAMGSGRDGGFAGGRARPAREKE